MSTKPVTTGPTDPMHWQRLAPIALVFLIISGLQKFIRENLYLFLGAGAGAAFMDWMGLRELMLAGIAIFLLLSVGAMVYHRRFRYRLEDDAVRVRKGLLVRREIRVRFARVQNIQISRPFYFRPFGLVRFSLETPGATEKEVELPGIPDAVAVAIRDRIAEQLNGRDTTDTKAESVTQAPVLYQPGTGRLFRHGMASNQIWLLAGAAAYVYSLFRERIEDWLSSIAVAEQLLEWVQSAWFFFPFVLLAAVVALQCLSGLIAIVRFHGFRLTDHGDRVVASAGLLDRREKTARREKLTGVVAAQSAVGRMIGCWFLVVKQASSMETDALEGHQKQFIIPGLARADFGLIGRLLPAADQVPMLNPISPGFRQIFWIRLFILLGAVLAVLVALLGRDHIAVLAMAASLPLVLAGVHLRWRHWGWAIEGQVLWVRQGFLGQRIEVVPLVLVQRAQVGQSPYQLRRDLADLQITLPQGNVTVPFLPHDTAARLANVAIFAAETARHHRV